MLLALCCSLARPGIGSAFSAVIKRFASLSLPAAASVSHPDSCASAAVYCGLAARRHAEFLYKGAEYYAIFLHFNTDYFYISNFIVYCRFILTLLLNSSKMFLATTTAQIPHNPRRKMFPASLTPFLLTLSLNWTHYINAGTDLQHFLQTRTVHPLRLNVAFCE